MKNVQNFKKNLIDFANFNQHQNFHVYHRNRTLRFFCFNASNAFRIFYVIVALILRCLFSNFRRMRFCDEKKNFIEIRDVVLTNLRNR